MGEGRGRGKKGWNRDGHGSNCKIQHWSLKKKQGVGGMGKKSCANSKVEGLERVQQECGEAMRKRQDTASLKV